MARCAIMLARPAHMLGVSWPSFYGVQWSLLHCCGCSILSRLNTLLDLCASFHIDLARDENRDGPAASRHRRSHSATLYTFCKLAAFQWVNPQGLVIGDQRSSQPNAPQELECLFRLRSAWLVIFLCAPICVRSRRFGRCSVVQVARFLAHGQNGCGFFQHHEPRLYACCLHSNSYCCAFRWDGAASLGGSPTVAAPPVYRRARRLSCVCGTIIYDDPFLTPPCRKASQTYRSRPRVQPLSDSG